MYRGRRYDVLKSSKHPTAYTKGELVKLAKKKLHFSESAAKKLTKEEIGELLCEHDPEGCELVFESEKDFQIQPHQQRIVDYLKTHRGVVAAFPTGSGKTLTAIVAAHEFLKESPESKVFFVTPKTLIENMKKEMVKFGYNPENPAFEFYTHTKFGRDFRDKQRTCKDNMLIIDEVHNLRTKVSAAKIKKSRKDAPGTKGYKLPTGKKTRKLSKAETVIGCSQYAKKILLLTATPVYNKPRDIINLVAMIRGNSPLTEKQFQDLLRNREKLKEYVKCVFSFHTPPRDKKFWPEIRIHNVEVEMSQSYFKKYQEVERREEESLFDFDPWKFLTGLRMAANAIEESPKADWIVKRIAQEGRKSLVYSSFIGFGINRMKKLLDALEIKHLEVVGSMTTNQRKKAVEKFNSDKPSSPQVMFITAAGGEGLDLKGVRDVYIFEGTWNESKEKQVYGRAARFKSHVHLPEEERYVDVWKVALVKPKGQRYRNASADVILRVLSEEKLDAFERILDIMREVSIENEVC